MFVVLGVICMENVREITTAYAGKQPGAFMVQMRECEVAKNDRVAGNQRNGRSGRSRMAICTIRFHKRCLS